MAIIRIVLLAMNWAAVLLLWGCCALTWLPSSVWPRLSVLCLSFPVLLAINVAFIPVWLLVRVRHIVTPLVGLAVAGAFILDYCPMRLFQKALPEDADSLRPTSMTIVTWNTANLQNKRMDDNLDNLIRYVDSLDATVLCLQECGGGHNVLSFKEHMIGEGYEWNETESRTIFTRLPLVSVEDLCPGNGANGVTAYRLLRPEVGDTLTLVSLHLQSYCLTSDELDIEPSSISPKDSATMHLWERLAQPQAQRAEQVQTAVRYIESVEGRGPIVVCGDFNETCVSYACRHILRQGLKSAYSERGRGPGFTYVEGLVMPVRIDHLMHSPSLECLSAEVDKSAQFSDHYPLIVRLR